MKRRTLFTALTALAAGAAVAPAVRLEAARQGVALAQGGTPDADAWDAIVAGYASEAEATAPGDLLDGLNADLIVLQHVVSAYPESRDLRRVVARLATLIGIECSMSGRARMAQRWWSTAHNAATRAGCAETAAVVRGKALGRGLYEQRPRAELLELAAVPVPGPSVGAAEQRGVQAMLLAEVGRRDEALAALAVLTELYEQLPGATTADHGVFGWPEYRLWHCASYVHTQLGNTRDAYAAQDQAFGLYPGKSRPKAMVRLHRARCLVLDGHLDDGLTEGILALDDVSPEHHGLSMRVLGTGVLAALPERERGRRTADELRQRLMPA